MKAISFMGKFKRNNQRILSCRTRSKATEAVNLYQFPARLLYAESKLYLVKAWWLSRISIRCFLRMHSMILLRDEMRLIERLLLGSARNLLGSGTEMVRASFQ